MLLLKNGNIINVYTGEILKGNIGILKDRILFVDYQDEVNINRLRRYVKTDIKVLDLKGRYVSPTFIDSHIHIESSHVIPSEFEKYALINGVSKVVIDPHEIANVLGVKGIEFMINSCRVLEVYCMVPSCVPATEMETSGAEITVEDVEKLFKNPLYKDRILGLGEVMNYIGVINEDEKIVKKIEIAKRYSKIVDGHAPKLRGLDLNLYIGKGIMSDHECTSQEEVLEKLRLGMKVMVREGTVSKNIHLLKIREEIGDIRNILLVSDDISIRDLREGYLLKILRKATKYVSPIEAIQMVTVNPANYFNFEVGIKPSNYGDLIIFDNLEEFKIDKVIIKGRFLEEYPIFRSKSRGNSEIYKKYIKDSNKLNYTYKSEEDFLIRGIDIDVEENRSARIIVPVKDSLITKEEILEVPRVIEELEGNRLNRIYVVERHKNTGNIGKGLIKLLKRGTLASSYAHDSHNVVVVGNDLRDITLAVNSLKDMGGGFIVVEEGEVVESLKLEVGGIMGYDGEYIYRKILSIEDTIKDYGFFKGDLFLTMSFLTLSVIPDLKITDFGLIKDNKVVDLIV
ncbi:MAG TPA: adenine deaminase [Methanothermococcus okinawensis]|nr:adenine deaminase [Methanothermococcus okinawensis]